MHVRDLGPALTAMGELFDRANFLVHEDRTSLLLKVKAPQPGSIQIEFLLYIYEQTMHFIQTDLSTARILVETLFGTYGLFKVIKRVKGRKSVPIETLPDQVIITTSDGERIEMSPEVFLLWQDVLVHRWSLELINPLRNQGNDRMVIGINNDVVDSVESSEVSSFVMLQDDHILSEEITDEELNIVSPYLGMRSAKWRFSDHTGTHAYTMSDSRYLEGVQSRTEHFTASDTLECRVKKTEILKKNGETRTDYEILEVLDHRSLPAAGEQLSLL